MKKLELYFKNRDYYINKLSLYFDSIDFKNFSKHYHFLIIDSKYVFEYDIDFKTGEESFNLNSNIYLRTKTFNDFILKINKLNEIKPYLRKNKLKNILKD